MKRFKFSDSTRKQLPWVILISLTTVVLISGIFGSLRMLQDANTQSSDNDGNTTNTSTSSEVKSELVIAYPNTQIDVALFSLSVLVTNHVLGDDGSLSTTVQITDSATQAELGTLGYTDLNQSQSFPGYTVKLKNATEGSVQLVIAKLSE